MFQSRREFIHQFTFPGKPALFTVFALHCLMLMTISVQATADETIFVKDVNGLHQALENLKGHSGNTAEIVLADGVYQTDHSLKLIGAQNVRISAVSAASILCTDRNAEVLVIAYCDDIQISKLTFGHQPDSRSTETCGKVVQVDDCTNVRLVDCTLEFSTGEKAEPTKDDLPMIIPPAVLEELGIEILSIVTEPDQIRSFKIDSTGKKATKMLGEFGIVGEGPILEPSQQKKLIGIILDENTYMFGISKNGFHTPEYGFEFTKGNQSVGLLVDYYRKELVFLFNGKEKIENCDAAVIALKELTAELFDK